MSDIQMHPYYGERRASIYLELKESLHLARPHFEQLIPDHAFDEVLSAALEEFECVLPTLPYVGGAASRMTQAFEQNAGVFALGRVLRRRRVPTGIMSQLLRHVFLAKLRTKPAPERLAMGESFMSDASRAMLRREAIDSQRREHPGDFVYRFVDAPSGPIAEFEFGLDYNECGFCKMSKVNGDEDILPMICAMDEESYELRGIELKRTTTLAAGDRCCNFRYRKLDPENS